MINYKPTVFKSSTNVKHKKPFRTVLRLLLLLIFFIFVFYVFLGFLVDGVARQITPSQEAWLWKNMKVHYDVEFPNKKKFKKMNKRLQDVFKKIPKDKLPVKYDFSVHLDHENYVNAFAVPGGQIIVTTALMEMLDDDRSLTFVLSHELGHFQGRHHLIGLGRTLVITMISSALLGQDISGAFAKMISLFDLDYSRSQELEADKWGLFLLKERYGDYKGSKIFFEKMEKKKHTSKLEEFFSTHPSPDHRIKNLEKYVEFGFVSK